MPAVRVASLILLVLVACAHPFMTNVAFAPSRSERVRCTPIVLAMAGAPGPLALLPDAVVYTDRRDGSLWRVPRAGGEGRLLAIGLRPLHDLAAADDGGVALAAGGLTLVDANGGTRTIDAGQDVAAVALAGPAIFWLRREAGTLCRAPWDGTVCEVVATGLGGPDALAVDAEAAYVTRSSGRGLVRIPLDLGRVTWLPIDARGVALEPGRAWVVGDTSGGVAALAVDALRGTTRFAGEGVVSVPWIPFTPRPPTATLQEPTPSLALGPHDVFWAEGARVLVASTRSSFPEVLAESPGPIVDLAADARGVYWSESEHGGVMACVLDGAVGAQGK